uniref:Uncharacterized protein n=1 Tax=Daphnia galeata TaxID=27404 RepID=A0A8J2WGX5_9CRUS|nr:unnamed protein product [Daphnia galeata]
MMEKDSPTISQRKLLCLSGGCLLDPHVECGFNYKYFPMDSVLKFNLVEDLLLWKPEYSPHLEESLTLALKPEIITNVDTMITGILNCLFTKNQKILEHFRNFEETFEKSSVISTILRTVARKHGPVLDVISFSKRQLLCLSGGCLLDPHVECRLNYKYFPIDSVVKFHLMEDILLWKQGYSSQLEMSLIYSMNQEYMNNVDTMIIGICNCLFVKSPDILQYFRNFEETFEKSSIISMILRTLARKHGPYLDVVTCTSRMKNWFYPNI